MSKCPVHINVTGKRKPRNKCLWCWRAYAYHAKKPKINWGVVLDLILESREKAQRDMKVHRMMDHES